jgi:hypothetical protein
MKPALESDITMQRIERMISQAWTKLSSGDKLGAAAVFTESAAEARKVTCQNVQLANCLSEIGVGLFMVGPTHVVDSVLYLTQSLKIFARELGAGSIECARIHRQMSAIFASSGMHQRSLISLRRAAEIFETLLAPSFAADAEPEQTMRIRQLSTRMEEFADARSHPVDFRGVSTPAKVLK